MTGRRKRSDELRFWDKTAPAANGCIEWTACRLPKGYGRYLTTLAHRWIYQHTHGVALGRMDFVMHTCDNPPCVNPEHLRLGTPSENTADMYTKGRARPTGAVGTRNNHAKMTPEQVTGYRERWVAGEATCAALSREAGITGVAMQAALSGKNWKHLPMPVPVR